MSAESKSQGLRDEVVHLKKIEKNTRTHPIHINSPRDQTKDKWVQ